MLFGETDGVWGITTYLEKGRGKFVLDRGGAGWYNSKALKTKQYGVRRPHPAAMRAAVNRKLCPPCGGWDVLRADTGGIRAFCATARSLLWRCF